VFFPEESAILNTHPLAVFFVWKLGFRGSSMSEVWSLTQFYKKLDENHGGIHFLELYFLKGE
jgi:hypothetical protein